MKKQMWIVAVLLCVLGAMPTFGGTLLLAMKGSPVMEIVEGSEEALLPLLGEIEAKVLDVCFDNGVIVSSFEPAVSYLPQGLQFSKTEVMDYAWKAREAEADWLVLLCLQSAEKKSTEQEDQLVPSIFNVSIEVHNLKSGKVIQKKLYEKINSQEELGRSLAKDLQGIL